MSNGKKIFKFLKFQIVLLIVVIAAIGYAARITELKMEAEGIVIHSTENSFRQTETSEVYDAKGRLVQILKGEKDVYYVDYEDLPIYVTQALISIEDKRFYLHDGVDYKAVIRATYSYLQKGEITQGGSTITQQLARTIFLTNERTFTRKIEEMFVAMEMEKKYSKEDILEYYLNNVYFANGYYGIQAAANGYFNRNVDKLSLSEVCFLIAIPNNPTTYDPVQNYDNTIRRRNLILDQMKNDGKITETTCEKAKAVEIELQRPDAIKHDYVATYADYCATRVLMEMDGFEFRTTFKDADDELSYNTAYNEMYGYWNTELFTRGYRIYTTIDMDMQALLQAAIDDCLVDFTECSNDGIYELQSAAVCIDNATGQVKAIVGGRSQEFSGYSLNRAYQSYRQPGSSIKPLIVYTPALELGNYVPDSIVVDEPIEDGPENSSGNYSGEITLRQAVMYSKNTIAWKLFEELTPQVGLQYLEDMGFQKLDSNDYFMASALGGMTYGVSPLEMAKGYATLANDGFMRDPNCISYITDAQGNVIYQAENEEYGIYKENAARYMTNMLQSVVTEGTAKGISLGDMPCAGKTGTTNKNKDGWFVGYTPYYTTSVWVGLDIPKKLPGLTGSSYPAVIWQTFMKDIHQDLMPTDFLLPVTYIGKPEEEMEELEEEEGLIDDFEQYEPETRTITQVFEGTQVPEGAIPEGATDITITTTYENADGQVVAQ